MSFIFCGDLNSSKREAEKGVKVISSISVALRTSNFLAKDSFSPVVELNVIINIRI